MYIPMERERERERVQKPAKARILRLLNPSRTCREPLQNRGAAKSRAFRIHGLEFQGLGHRV